MNKVNVEKVIDYTKVLKDNEILQDMDKILRNENINLKLEIERLNNIINKTTKYVQSLSSKGRGCDIYEDIKQEILKELKGVDKE